MIPVHLQLKNFLSYGPQTQAIDFRPHHLICLSGKNGHGKSALLDAITWAIWGHARKTAGASKADDGLLRLGQTYMAVTFEFMCNDIQYRVRREYTRNARRGETRLYLGMYDTKDEQFRSLTENTSRDTQRVIQRIVGLDYESFTNSVFIRQGQSNAFSRKSPKERKEILTNILGLQRYEQYRQHAQEYVKKLDAHIQHTESLCNQMHSELEQEPKLQDELKSSNHTLHTIQQREESLVSQDHAYYQSDQAYAQQEHELDNLRSRYQHITTYYDEHIQHLRSLVDAWRQTFREYQIIADGNVASQYERQKAHVDHLAHQYAAYQRAYQEFQKAEHRSEARKQTLYEQFLQQLHDLRHTCSQYETQLYSVADKLSHAQEQLHTYENRYNKLRHDIHSLRNVGEEETPSPEDVERQLEQALRQSGRLRGMQRLLEARSHYHTNSHHTVREHRIDRAHTCAENRIIQLRTNLTHARDYYEAIKQRQRSVASHEEQLHDYLREILHVTAECKRQRKEYARIHQLFQQWKEKRDTHAHNSIFRSWLNHDTEYIQWNRIAREQHDIMQKTRVDQETYDAAQEHLNVLKHKLETLQSQHSYTQVQRERRQHIRTIIRSLKGIKQEARHITRTISQYPDIQHKRSHIQQERDTIAQNILHARKEKDHIMQRKGAVEQQLRTLHHKRQEYENKQRDIAHYTHKRNEYAHIAHAFSRDGIQALLIENAIPEIENEANALLRQLTDNQSQLQIDSLRDLKSGKTKETLDIKISDSMGIRPYELFSGGEAFRIDFAIRVAISTLVARRAGTQLQTLIIDEGFGSQDEDGLSHIIDAMYRVQHHFSKIIIVSHLASLKGQFPAQFIVHKGPYGSNVTVHEQG